METHVAPSPPTDELLPGGIKPRWKMGDLMRFFGFSRTKTWNLIHQYGLPCYQIGEDTSPLLFDPDEVVKWAEQYKHVLKPRRAANN